MRVRRILQRRGAPLSTIDDVLQTAAMRALQRSEGFDGVDGCVNWITRVAWHEVQAEWHRQARTAPSVIPELPDSHDPARIVEGRFDLDAIKHALTVLTPDERAAVLAALDDGLTPDGPLEARMKMRRSRARQRLARIVSSVSEPKLRPVSPDRSDMPSRVGEQT